VKQVWNRTKKTDGGIRDKKGETFNKTAESINQSWRIDIGGKKCVLTKCTEINKKKTFEKTFTKESRVFFDFFLEKDEC